MSSSNRGRRMITWTQVVLVDTGGIWGQTADEAPSADIMREDDYGDPVREALWRPFHVHYRGDAWIPSLFQQIKYCGGHGHTYLG